jgi:hypothetical protein
MKSLIIFVILFQAVFVSGLLQGYCDKKRYVEIAKTMKSPNTMYYVVTIISLKTSTSPHLVAKCLGFYWHKNLQENKYTIQISSITHNNY